MGFLMPEGLFSMTMLDWERFGWAAGVVERFRLVGAHPICEYNYIGWRWPMICIETIITLSTSRCACSKWISASRLSPSSASAQTASPPSPPTPQSPLQRSPSGWTIARWPDPFPTICWPESRRFSELRSASSAQRWGIPREWWHPAGFFRWSACRWACGWIVLRAQTWRPGLRSKSSGNIFGWLSGSTSATLN